MLNFFFLIYQEQFDFYLVLCTRSIAPTYMRDAILLYAINHRGSLEGACLVNPHKYVSLDLTAVDGQ